MLIVPKRRGKNPSRREMRFVILVLLGPLGLFCLILWIADVYGLATG